MREMNLFTIREAPTEGLLPKNIRKHLFSGLGVCVIAGIILSILAPYGTVRMSFIARLIYWIILCMAGALGAGIFIPLATRAGIKLNRVSEIIGQSITSSLLVTALLVGWNYVNASSIDIIEAGKLFFLVWVIGIVITTFIHMTEKATTPETANKNQRPALFERLKPDLRNSEIYALMAEDHYVRVYTSKGDDLILMRLTDAIKEVGGIRGLSIHRSWWVAEAGVKKARKTEGKITLELHSGQIAQVSRSNNKAVKESGWIS